MRPNQRLTESCGIYDDEEFKEMLKQFENYVQTQNQENQDKSKKSTPTKKNLNQSREDFQDKTQSSKKTSKKTKTKKKTSILACIMRPFFASSSIIDRDTVSGADLTELREDLKKRNLLKQIEQMHQEIEFKRQQAVSQGKKYEEKSIFTLYHKIIMKLTLKDRLWLKLILIVQFCSLIIQFNLVIYVSQVITAPGSYVKDQDSGKVSPTFTMTAEFVYFLAGIIVCIIISRIAYITRQERENTIKLKAKNALTVMVYQKLIISHESFINSLNPNTIFTVLGSGLEDYSAYMNCWLSVIKVFVYLIGIFSRLLFFKTPNLKAYMLSFISSFFFVFFSAASSIVITILFGRYRALKGEEREILAEILITRTTLSDYSQNKYYAEKLERIGKPMEKMIGQIQSNITRTSRVMTFTSFYGPITAIFIMIFSNFDKFWNQGEALTENDQNGAYLQMDAFVAHICQMIYIVPWITSSLNQMESYFRQKSAKSEIFEPFLANPNVIQKRGPVDCPLNPLKNLSTSPEGSIQIINCDTYKQAHLQSETAFRPVYKKVLDFIDNRNKEEFKEKKPPFNGSKEGFSMNKILPARTEEVFLAKPKLAEEKSRPEARRSSNIRASVLLDEQKLDTNNHSPAKKPFHSKPSGGSFSSLQEPQTVISPSKLSKRVFREQTSNLRSSDKILYTLEGGQVTGGQKEDGSSRSILKKPLFDTISESSERENTADKACRQESITNKPSLFSSKRLFSNSGMRPKTNSLGNKNKEDSHLGQESHRALVKRESMIEEMAGSGREIEGFWDEAQFPNMDDPIKIDRPIKRLSVCKKVSVKPKIVNTAQKTQSYPSQTTKPSQKPSLKTGSKSTSSSKPSKQPKPSLPPLKKTSFPQPQPQGYKRSLIDLNLTIKKGEKVCVYDRNPDKIDSFIALLTGESLLTNGQIIWNTLCPCSGQTIAIDLNTRNSFNPCSSPPSQNPALQAMAQKALNSKAPRSQNGSSTSLKRPSSSSVMNPLQNLPLLSVSYYKSSHLPYLVGKTIRDNILDGQEFSINRYDQILALLKAKFDTYEGGDFYQIGEKGRNLKTSDRKILLLARFLYRDCQVYILRDFLQSVDIDKYLGLVDKIINGFLKEKTVIFVSRDPRIMKLSSKVIRFRQNYRYDIIEDPVSLAEFVDKKLSKKPVQKRVFHLRRKILPNLCPPESAIAVEIYIQKKIEGERKKIEAMKIEKNNIADKIAYGIYLTKKRRQEGQNLQEIVLPDPQVLVSNYFKWQRTARPYAARLKWTLLMGAIGNICQVLCEGSMVVYFFVYQEQDGGVSLRLGLKQALISLGLFFVSYASIGIKDLIKFGPFRALYGEGRSGIIKKLLTGDYAWMNSLYYHEVLSKIGENLTKVYILGYADLALIPRQFNTILACLVLLIIIYSAIIPLILFSLYIFLVLYIVYRIFPSYLKLISFAYYNRFRKNQLIYQLPHQILSHRVSQRMEKLNEKFFTFSENASRNEGMVTVTYPMLLIKVLGVVQIGTSAIFLSLMVLYLKYEDLNLFRVPRTAFVWTIPLLYRLIISMDSLLIHLLRIASTVLDFYHVQTFLEESNQRLKINKGKPADVVDEEEVDSVLEQDLSKPIFFKEVSLCLGYQLFIKSLSFRLKPSQSIALVEVDGGGRGSIFDLILGQKVKDWQKQSKLRVFNMPPSKLTPELRSSIRVQNPTPVLYRGTVRENIDPFRKYSDQKIIDLLLELGIEKILNREVLIQELYLQKANPETIKKLVNSRKSDFFRATSDEPKIQSPSKFAPKPIIEEDSEKVEDWQENENWLFTSYKNDTYNLKEKEPEASKSKEKPFAQGAEKFNEFPKLAQDMSLGVKETNPWNPNEFMASGQKEEDSILEVPHAEPAGSDRKIGGLNSGLDCSSLNPDIYNQSFEQKDKDNQKSLNIPRTRSPKRGGTDAPKSILRKRRPTHLSLSQLIQVPRSSMADLDKTQYIPSHASDSSSEEDELVSDKESLSGSGNRIYESLLQYEGNIKPDLKEFLQISVEFTGQNFKSNLKRLISFARTILEKPRLFLVHEIGIEFGYGVQYNLSLLKKKSPEVSILSIINTSNDILFYDNALLLDKGVTIEQGNPKRLLLFQESCLTQYLEQTDPELLLKLRNHPKVQALNSTRRKIAFSTNFFG